MIKIDGPLNEEQDKSLSRIRNSARHLLKLIDDVLNISKIESAKVKLDIRQLDVRKQIDSVLSSFEPLLKQKGLSLVEHVAEDLPTCVWR